MAKIYFLIAKLLHNLAVFFDTAAQYWAKKVAAYLLTTELSYEKKRKILYDISGKRAV